MCFLLQESELKILEQAACGLTLSPKKIFRFTNLSQDVQVYESLEEDI